MFEINIRVAQRGKNAARAQTNTRARRSIRHKNATPAVRAGAPNVMVWA